jgi:hypothetical protein
MKILNYSRLIIAFIALSMLFYIFGLSQQKNVIDWRIKNVPIYSNVDDLYLVNNNYSLIEICELTAKQKESKFFKICRFIKDNELSSFSNSDDIIDHLRIFLAKKEIFDSLTIQQKESLLKLIHKIDEINEYRKVHKSYFLQKLTLSMK